MENQKPTISAAEGFNALVDAMGALVQVFCRHLPPEAAPQVATDLERLARTCGINGKAASAMLLNDLAEAARSRSDGPETTH